MNTFKHRALPSVPHLGADFQGAPGHLCPNPAEHDSGPAGEALAFFPRAGLGLPYRDGIWALRVPQFWGSQPPPGFLGDRGHLPQP